MENETIISVKNVSKDFRLPHKKVTTIKGLFTGILQNRHQGGGSEVQHTLRDITFEVKKGEFFGIVGRNGSGKSTMLKILAGIYQPTSGDVAVRGKLVPFIELGVGFNPELTGKENVYLNGALLGFSSSEVDAFYDEVVEFAELKKFMDQKLKNYSSGMQVRLAFSMAIRAKADILLIDEVLAVGDADFQRKCYNYFKKLKKLHITVVFISHDMEAVKEYCDRAMLIEDGRVVAIGSTSSIAEGYIKMFTHSAVSTRGNAEGDRWGDGEIMISSLQVTVTDRSIDIKQLIKAHRQVPGCVVGIRVRNAAGEHITGTNTKLEGIRIDALSQGATTSIRWSFPNILSDGDYFIDSAVQHEDGITVHDWLDEAAAFSVRRTRKVPYPADPGFTVKIGK